MTPFQQLFDVKEQIASQRTFCANRGKNNPPAKNPHLPYITYIPMQSNIVGVGEGPGKAQTSICFNFRRLHRATLQEYLILTCNNIIHAFKARLSMYNIVDTIWLSAVAFECVWGGLLLESIFNTW